MAGFVDVVHATRHGQRLHEEGNGVKAREERTSGQDQHADATSQCSQPGPSSTSTSSKPERPKVESAPRASVPDSPSSRTGPPRSLSFNYPLPNSPVFTTKNMTFEDDDIMEDTDAELGTGFPFRFRPRDSTFRGALDYESPVSEHYEKDAKGKGKENRIPEKPHKWLHESFHESPKEETFDLVQQSPAQPPRRPARHQTMEPTRRSTLPPKETLPLQRSQSHPHLIPEKKATGSVTWGRLRSLLPHVTGHSPTTQRATHSVVTPPNVNITDELITGGLSTLILRLWFERDERGHRRIPVLFHRLRIRISDSLHPLHGNKAVFRIECEYANGAARWVIYRELRDFISLHAHYTISNAYNRNRDAIPEFPRTSLPYFKFLKRESKGGQVRQTDFARLQREALEDYLLNLIRAVMFHPTANRLASFLEISALFISLAQSSGAQYKAGFLRIESLTSKGPPLGRKSAKWSQRRESRWCAVRESYLVILEEPGELAVWDVFLLDSDFKIERPTRYYRKGLHLLQSEALGKDPNAAQAGIEGEADCMSVIGSIKSKLSTALCRHPKSSSHVNEQHMQLSHRAESSSSGSSASSIASHSPAPMLDPSTNVNPLAREVHDQTQDMTRQQQSAQEAKRKKRRQDDVSKHTFYIENSQMRLKLFARNERQMLQWITALEKAAATCHYCGNNRFESYAPIRMNVAAQWLVDGRDYMWNLSRAILLARETIYIHDWWISPELQLRRPNKDRYRLDRLLERKAKEGVKIYIILYLEVSNWTTPTDSNYTKQRLTSLHPNIMVQRSPSHFQTGTFYWAHHEKLCVIDQTIAFMGGIDLCFGRWDTPQHVIVDDAELSPEQTEIWPGKDYSNPRILDFHTLNKPEEDMYDRTKVPRMPWHDVGMQVVGQPARDVARHFVERWNWLLRIKNHSRVMPFLLPPPEFKPKDLSAMGLTGTCEMQICRSAGPWSLGTPGRIEHSIANAYLKAIEMSEHFVYIENQFFITSTVVNDVKVENMIGNALVDRIIRAHRQGTAWKCCIILPLLPGFPFPVDHSDASAIRIIIECQNRTIFRGPHSIFSRLRKEGIDPVDYISVFALRNWGKLHGDVLTTEIVYVHGKVCIVDDRLAIIGSANINERSQRGERDSEIAAVIRDTDMIDGTMAGKPFKVGRFAHTLRVRLMREHVGVDVDAMSEKEFPSAEAPTQVRDKEEWDPDAEEERGREKGVMLIMHDNAVRNVLSTVSEEIKQTTHALGDAMAESTTRTPEKPLSQVEINKVNTPNQDTSLQEERMTYCMDGRKQVGFASSMVSTLEEKIISEHIPPAPQAHGESIMDGVNDRGPPEAHTADGEAFGASAYAPKSPQTDDQPPHAGSGINDTDETEQAAPGVRSILRKHLASRTATKPWTLPMPTPEVDPEGFDDPICDAFWTKVWVACAVHNTEIYRKAFHVIPDDLVTTWKQYKEFVMQQERFNKRQNHTPEVPSETVYEDVPHQKGGFADKAEALRSEKSPPASKSSTEESKDNISAGMGNDKEKDTRGRKPTKGFEPFDKQEREEMEELLKQIQGNLVIYPTRFLEGEDIAENFLFNADRILPLPIYT